MPNGCILAVRDGAGGHDGCHSLKQMVHISGVVPKAIATTAASARAVRDRDCNRYA